MGSDKYKQNLGQMMSEQLKEKGIKIKEEEQFRSHKRVELLTNLVEELKSTEDPLSEKAKLAILKIIDNLGPKKSFYRKKIGMDKIVEEYRETIVQLKKDLANEEEYTIYRDKNLE